MATKLGKLNTGDVFYWKGGKYSVFFTLKDKSKAKRVHVMDHPMPNGTYDMPAGRLVKPIHRVRG